jgi:hypothetical protein
MEMGSLDRVVLAIGRIRLIAIGESSIGPLCKIKSLTAAVVYFCVVAERTARAIISAPFESLSLNKDSYSYASEASAFVEASQPPRAVK